MPEESRLYTSRPLLAASLAVFRGDRVLLARRAKAPLIGRFSLPGGLVEPGELLAEAALRETREEVDVVADIIGFNQHVEVIERDAADVVRRHYVIASFVATWRAGEGAPSAEADAVIWARLDEIGALPTTEHLMPVLEAAWTIVQRQDDFAC